MIIKRVIILLGILFSVGITITSFAEDHAIEQMEHHKVMNPINDGRISLNLSPQMKAHQLSNMRSHIVAIQTIIGLIGEGDFNKASKIAHSKLGMTEKMKKMCNMFDNDNFKKLGLQFHKSADILSDVLQTKDMNKSLRALHNTMNYCIQCHAIFRQ
jgi:hypothetical protein